MDYSTPSPSPPIARVAWRGVSLGGSAAISLLILYGISRAQQTSFVEPEPLREELRALIAETPPPPPPPPAASIEPPPLEDITFDAEPAAGGIVIAASVQPLAPAEPKLAEIRLDFDLKDFAPTTDRSHADGQHVYRIAEVDRRPLAVYRVSPKFYAASIKQIENPFVEILFIVNPNGIAEDIQILHAPHADLAAATIEALQEWKFRPAMRGGRKVRCLVQQTILLRAPDVSPFSR